MPISIKYNAINAKSSQGYNNVSAFFLGDVNEWLDEHSPYGYVTPEMYGAIGDGVTDDTEAWQAAIATGQIIFATGTYKCTEPLEFDNSVYCLGTIINNASNGVKIIGKSKKTYWINVRAISETQGSTRIGVEVKNCGNCNFRISTDNFYIGLEMHGDGVGCVYNSIETLFTANAFCSAYLLSENSGWVNENYFYNHRAACWTSSLYVGSNYGVIIEKGTDGGSTNSNHFVNGCYEGAYCGVYIKNGSYNTFENIRMEGCTNNAIFDSGTFRNIVYPSYAGGTATDNGTNAVINIADIITKFTS